MLVLFRHQFMYIMLTLPFTVRQTLIGVPLFLAI